MNIPIITVYTDPERIADLVNSATKQGWELILIQAEWRGFGTKLISVYEYLMQHPEVERFVFCDAYDVVVLGTEAEFERKLNETYSPPKTGGLIMSAEKGLWPPDMEKYKGLYFDHAHGFNFINSGLYYATSNEFIKLFNQNKPSCEYDDQRWMHETFAHSKHVDIWIDNDQRLFNSHSFIAEGEYGYENGRVQVNGNEPIFIHSNGRTIDPKLEELL